MRNDNFSFFIIASHSFNLMISTITSLFFFMCLKPVTPAQQKTPQFHPLLYTEATDTTKP